MMMVNKFGKLSEEGICYKCKDPADSEEGHTCEQCKEFFDHPEEESEYNERMRENALEERADAKRKYNE